MSLRFQGRVVWITGASSGIGEAVAYRFAQEGARLIVSALEDEQLSHVAARCVQLGAPEAFVLPCDLSRLDSLETLAEQAWARFGRIDILYNNAGISQRGTAVETEMSVIRKVMDIDFYAPVILTKSILPRMIAQGGGQLAVTTSIAGCFGFPMRCAYSSAKHALYGFFETVQAENYKDNVRVTIVCPGRVRTNISLHALESDGRQHGKMDAGQAGGISPEKAARKIVRAIYRRRREVLIGSTELTMAYIKRFFPGLCARLARKVKSM
ncbi:MAG: short-chain dehydrogenase/reductase SDR [bacterium P3]|nr:MAG: short-chain dehydrogenase/reductase SDR [bacterium P3]KWW40148.1 MAG: short-chain dehydrogenase/reductase SDR [bacterium F083]